MKTLSLVLLSSFVVLGINPVTAQIRHWTLGGSGDAWEDVRDLNLMSDLTSAPGALQNLELRPDVNVVPIIYSAHDSSDEGVWELWQNPPNPLWEAGIPRFYRGSGNFGSKTPGPTTTVMVDGDDTTWWSQENFGPGGCKMQQEFHTLALGGALPLERFVLRMPPTEITDLFGRPFAEYVPKNGELSAGWLGAEGQTAEEQRIDLIGGGCCGQDSYEPFNDVLGNVQNNIESPLVFDFPLTYYSHVRWVTYEDPVGLETTSCGVARAIGYADLELYGRGFAAQSSFRTVVLDLGEPAILGDVDVNISKWRRGAGHWEEILDDLGEVVDRSWVLGDLVEEPNAEVDVTVRVKTGTTDNPRQYFTYTDFGELEAIDAGTWDSLDDSALLSCHGKCATTILKKEPGWRGPVVQNRDDWSAWSGPIRDQTARLALAKGRYFQVLVTMATGRPTDVGRVESVDIEILPLLVPRLVGEVALDLDATAATLAQVRLGEPAELTYAIRADFQGRRSDGFDAIHISTPSRPEFLHLRRGDPLAEVELADDAVELDEDGLTIFLANPVAQNEEIRVGLRTTLFTVSEKLLGEVFERSDSEVRQVIDEGNATDEIATDQLQVVTEDNVPEAIADLLVEPRAFTPNGDGNNDELIIRYTLYGVIDTDVEIGIFTVDGRLVRKISKDGQRAGVNAPVMWNGRDESGSLLAPGLYLCQVETETSRGRFATTTPISIAY